MQPEKAVTSLRAIGDTEHRRTMSGREHLRPAAAHNDQTRTPSDGLQVLPSAYRSAPR